MNIVLQGNVVVTQRDNLPKQQRAFPSVYEALCYMKWLTALWADTYQNEENEEKDQ